MNFRPLANEFGSAKFCAVTCLQSFKCQHPVLAFDADINSTYFLLCSSHQSIQAQSNAVSPSSRVSVVQMTCCNVNSEVYQCYSSQEASLCRVDVLQHSGSIDGQNHWAHVQPSNIAILQA